MLRETVMEWTREWTREGEVKMLVLMLEGKLGSLREDIRQRVHTADEEQLFDWAECALTAESLSEIFGS